MSTQSQTLGQWVTDLNKTLFFQPDDELALKAAQEQIDPSFVIKVNHDVFTYDRYKPGIQEARASSTIVQDAFSIILQWENPENPGGTVAALSKYTSKDKATGKETRKTNLILYEVKWIDGKRKLTSQTEVESE
ncbi:hypothetical protein ACJ41O_014429 [Fusarium nematophilum]